MKIIDSKGKLFGLVNIIDLAIIVCLIVFGYISFNLIRNAKLGYPMEIETKVLFPSLSLEIVKKIQPGDMEDSRCGHSKLIRFEVKEPYIEKDSNRFADIHAQLKLSVRVKDVVVGNRGKKVANYFLKGQELNIDDPIIFTTPKYSIHGTLLNIRGMDREIEVVPISGFSKELLDSIKVGDNVFRWQHLVGEVVAKGYMPDGRPKIRLHIKRGEVALKIGHQFSFEADKYYVYCTIIQSRPWKKD